MSFNKRMLSAGAAPFVPSEHFGIVTYTGNSSDQSITGLGFQPDLVWIKERDDGAENQNWIDSTRGTGNILASNNANAAFASGRFTSFDSDGFTLANNNETNDNNVNYVAWCWKAGGGSTSSNSDGSITSTVQTNRDAGFSIVKYTGNGTSGATIGHNLGAVPHMFIVKRTSSSGTWNWRVYHKEMDSSNPENYNMALNGNASRYDRTEWNDTAPTSTVFSVDDHGSVNESSKDYICYAFTEISGYSKFGTYTGDRTNDVIVETGFEVSWVLIKAVDATDDWFIISQKTGNTQLYANKDDAEASFTGVSFLSNGFMLNGAANSGGTNNDGTKFIYMAFATDPDEEAPTLSNSFNMLSWIGNEATRSITGAGFAPNWIWIKETTSTSYHVTFDSIRGPDNQLYIKSDAESTNAATISSFDTDGWTMDNGLAINEDEETYIGWIWKGNDDVPTINDNGSTDSIVSVNSNAGFSIVSYRGTGSNATIGHGLSQAPDMIWFKNRDASASWLVYHQGLGNEKALYLETTGAPTDSNAFFQDTDPTSTVFSVGTHADPNGNTNRIIAYCFHDVTGYSKFGSYTGNGSAGQAITTGFKPDFVLIRTTVGTDNWRVYDTRRNRGLNQFMQPNNNDAQEEHLGNDNPHLTITSTGFTITSDGNSQGNNADGNLYLYAAFKKNVTSNTTLANSFKTVTYSGNGSTQSITGTGFKPDLVWIKQRSGTQVPILYDSIRGEGDYIISSSNGASGHSSSTLTSFDSDGFSVGSSNSENQSSNTFVAWCWKAGNTWEYNIDGDIPSLVNVNTANGFSIVKYTATGSTATIGHGLSSAPELIIAKTTNQSYDWLVYHSSLGNDVALQLHSNAAAADNSFMNDTSPTSTVFTAASGNNLNYADGNEIIAYCWHSVSGYSKFGTYSGSGSDGNAVSLGFQPDYVMIKRTNSTGGWLMFDSVRSTSNPRNDRIEANNTQAEQTDSGDKWLDFNSTDFEANGSDTEVNASGSTYAYIAFKAN